MFVINLKLSQKIAYKQPLSHASSHINNEWDGCVGVLPFIGNFLTKITNNSGFITNNYKSLVSPSQQQKINVPIKCS